ncbi:MAG: hypothetical protein J0H39_21280 [Alphaproteobacteria bacterium]|nr:hypothetical protein [Alphaproteobacteria bacterium]
MPRRRSKKSFWDSLKTGRLEEFHGDEFGLFASGFGAQRRAISLALLQRGRWVTGQDRLKKDRAPVIVKQVSNARSIEAVRRIARYIGRLGYDYGTRAVAPASGVQVEDLASDRVTETPRPARYRPPSGAAVAAAEADRGKKPRVYDQWGIPVARDRMLEKIAEWPLLDDLENLARAGQRAVETGGMRALNALDEDVAFAQVQALHIVISVPEPEDDPLGLRFESVLRRFMRQSFGAFGCRALVALHHEHGRFLHAHVLAATVKPVSLLIEGYERRGLRQGSVARFGLDRHGFTADALRLLLAEVAREEGYEVDASRREDRAEMRKLILAGLEPLRTRPVTRSFDRPPTSWTFVELPPLLRRAVRKLPVTLAGYSADILANISAFEAQWGQSKPPPAEPGFWERAAGWLTRETAPVPPPIDANDDAQRAALAALRDWLIEQGVFADLAAAHSAIDLWRTARAENYAFADWALCRAPQLFGTLGKGTAQSRDTIALRDRLRMIEPDTPSVGGRGRLDEILQELSPKSLEARRAEIELALVDQLSRQVLANPELEGRRRIARRGQAGIVQSFNRLAWGLRQAFPEDERTDAMAFTVEMIAKGIAAIPDLPLEPESEVPDRQLDGALELARRMRAYDDRERERERRRIEAENARRAAEAAKKDKPSTPQPKRRRDDDWDR